MHAAMKMAKIPQNRQIRRADFALTKLTESSIHQIRRNRKIHQHLLGLTQVSSNLPFSLLRAILDLNENLCRETLFHFFHPIVIISTAQSYVAQPFGNFTNMLKRQLHLFCLFSLKPLQYFAKQKYLKEAYGFNKLLTQHSSRITSPFHPR